MLMKCVERTCMWLFFSARILSIFYGWVGFCHHWLSIIIRKLELLEKYIRQESIDGNETGKLASHQEPETSRRYQESSCVCERGDYSRYSGTTPHRKCELVVPNGNYRCHITKHFNKLRTISLRILVMRMSNFRKLLSTNV